MVKAIIPLKSYSDRYLLKRSVKVSSAMFDLTPAADLLRPSRKNALKATGKIAGLLQTQRGSNILRRSLPKRPSVFNPVKNLVETEKRNTRPISWRHRAYGGLHDATIHRLRCAGPRGRSLRTVYLDPNISEDEIAKIFHRGWVYVGHSGEIPEPGDYRLRKIGRAPVIMVRDDRGEVRLC